MKLGVLWAAVGDQCYQPLVILCEHARLDRARLFEKGLFLEGWLYRYKHNKRLFGGLYQPDLCLIYLRGVD